MNNLLLSARLAQSGVSTPGWLIKKFGEEAAAKYLSEEWRDQPVCPSCFLAMSVNGMCECSS